MRSAARQSLVMLAFVLALTGCDAFTSPQQRIARARTEIASGQWALAAVELRKLVQANAGNAQAWLLLAQLSLDAGDGGSAQANLDHARTAGAAGPEVDGLRARIWLQTGHPQALLDALTRHELTHISDSDRTVLLARAYDALGQPGRAIELLTPIVASRPHFIDAQLAQAEALARAGQSDQALAQLDGVLAADPHAYAASMQRGLLLETRGRFQPAERSFAAAIRDMPASTSLPDRAMALAGLTEARLAQGEIDLAAQGQAALAKFEPGAAITQLLGARVKLARGDELGGIADLQALVARVPNFVQAQILLGNAEQQQGNLEQARQAFEQVVRLAPDSPQAREQLASLRLKLNQPGEALSTLTPLLSQEALDPRLLALLGAAQTQAGSSDSVVRALEGALKAHPQDRTVRLNLAQAYLSAGRAPQALSLIDATPEVENDLRRDGLLVVATGAVRGEPAASAQVEKLLAAHPRNARILAFAANYYASLGQLAQAQGLLHQALALNGHDVSTLVGLARVDASAGDLSAAEHSLRSALATDSSSAPLRIALAELLMRRKAFDEAAALLAPLGGAHAGPQVQFARASLALARGDLKQANSVLDQAIAQQPKNADLIEQSGDLLMQANQYDAALARFAQASALAADNAGYWLNTGRAQLALNEESAARESFDRALRLAPQSLPAVSALVLVDLRAKNFQSARTRVAQLLTSRPQDAGVLTLQGDVEWAAGQLAAAQATYLQAQQRRPSAAVAAKLFRVRSAMQQPNPEQPLVQWLTRQPGNRTIRILLGDYYLARQELRPAAEQFQTILGQVPTDLVALNNLAWCYSELHDPRAESLAERAYQLAPTMSNVNDTLGWILAEQGKSAQALPLLAQAVKLDANDPDMQYHYAYALVQQGQRVQAEKILSGLLAGKREFDSRRDAERLLAATHG